MQPIDVTWGKVVRIYWLVLWRSTLGGTLLGLIAGFVIGFFGTILHVEHSRTQGATAACGALIGIVWSVYVMRMAIRKRYRGFRIVLVQD